MVASVVPSAPDSPTLNAAVAIEADRAPEHLEELHAIRQGEGQAVGRVARRLGEPCRAGARAGRAWWSRPRAPGWAPRSTSWPAPRGRPRAALADLTTVGRVNDLAYGNYDARLERTLAPLPNGILKGYRADLQRQAGGRCADAPPRAGLRRLVRRHDPKARRKGLASTVMRQALAAARDSGCTTTTLQATEVGERLYTNLGYRHLCVMQLWERRP